MSWSSSDDGRGCCAGGGKGDTGLAAGGTAAAGSGGGGGAGAAVAEAGAGGGATSAAEAPAAEGARGSGGAAAAGTSASASALTDLLLDAWRRKPWSPVEARAAHGIPAGVACRCRGHGTRARGSLWGPATRSTRRRCSSGDAPSGHRSRLCRAIPVQQLGLPEQNASAGCKETPMSHNDGTAAARVGGRPFADASPHIRRDCLPRRSGSPVSGGRPGADGGSGRLGGQRWRWRWQGGGRRAQLGSRGRRPGVLRLVAGGRSLVVGRAAGAQGALQRWASPMSVTRAVVKISDNFRMPRRPKQLGHRHVCENRLMLAPS